MSDKNESDADEKEDPSFDALLRDVARADSSLPVDLVGKTLAQFRVRAKLGQGGMGVVYKATDERLKRDVALKVLPAGAETSPAQRQRFLREARAAAAITHASIATVYEIGEAEGHAFIAMELVKGATLRERMAAGLTIAESVRIAREVARGLAKAHERGVVHRDLKPDNVMLTDEGDVKILDFGIAKMWEPTGAAGALADTAAPETAGVTAKGQVMGTPAYMSPEQARGEAADARSDVFSFGAMLYEMLTGAQPFVGEVSVAVLYAVIHATPSPVDRVNTQLPKSLSQIVSRCLEKRREARFASGRDLAAALELHNTGGEPTSAREPAVVIRPSGGGASGSGPGGVTELGTTITPEALRAVVPTPAPTPPGDGDVVGELRTHVEKRARWGVLGMLLVAATVAAVVIGWRVRGGTQENADSPRAPAAVSAIPPGATPLGGNPMTPNAQAMAEYRHAMADWHDAVAAPQLRMLHAVELDPDFAAANLRIAFFTWQPMSSQSYREAVRARTRLDAWDQELLLAEQPLELQTPPDYAEGERRFQALLAKRPSDLEVLLRLGWIETTMNKLDVARARYKSAIALAPNFAAAWFELARIEQQDGNADQARRAFESCVRVSPGAARCIRTMAKLDGDAGDCQRYFEGVRRAVTIAPEDNFGQMFLALAELTAGHGPDGPRAIAETQRQISATFAAGGPSRRAQDAAEEIAGRIDAETDFWFGSLTSARRRFASISVHLQSTPTTMTDAHAWTSLELVIAQESGDESETVSSVATWPSARPSRAAMTSKSFERSPPTTRSRPRRSRS